MRTIIFLLICATSASAQQWSFEAQAGRIRSTLDRNATSSRTIVGGLRYDDDLTGFRVSAGVPTQSTDALWGAIGVARRVQVETNGFDFGVDVAGNGFLVHDRVQRTQTITHPGNGGLFGSGPTTETVPAPSQSGSAWAAQLMPLIGYNGAQVQATLRAGVSNYTSNFANTKLNRRVKLGDAQLTFTPSPTVAVMPTLRFYQADEGNYNYAGVSAVTANGPVSVWGSAGSWLNQKTDNFAYAAGAEFKVHPNASILISARHDGVDPLYMTPPQNAWSAGVSLHFGGRTAAAPIPAKYESGRATIRVDAKDRTAVQVAGDFNGWKPQPMQRSGKDWTYTTQLKPGVYNFAFVDDHGNWFVPEKYPGRKADGMGGYVAVLVVQ